MSPSVAVQSAAPAATPSDEFLRLIPRSYARRHLILSAGRHGGSEQLWIAESTDRAAVHNAATRLGVPVGTAIMDSEALASQIDQSYGRESSIDELRGPAESQPGDIERLVQQADRDLLSTSGKGPVVKLVDAMLFEALGRSGSDIHIQPMADRTLVRYRVDGVLHDVRQLPPQVTLAVTSRVKVMGRMDVAERRLAQDGRATVTLGQGPSAHSVDLRISTFPTSYGERVVIRLLDNSRAAHLMDFASLGMPGDQERAFLARAGRSSGILLVTGPTGSGKTTTLYATLRWIATHDCGAGKSRAQNIVTIEDPIEYELSTVGLAISQAQVNTRKGVTFASGLRHMLRQDPDVIMVGEIRDTETARVAIQASLTGHLVLSTLHTNDAIGAVTRLVDLGIERYLAAASLSGILAQRLIRVSHSSCRGAGCEECHHSGYRGRRGVFELLLVDEQLRQLVTSGAGAEQLRAQARANRMLTLLEEGARLVREGVTTQDEVQRVIQGID